MHLVSGASRCLRSQAHPRSTDCAEMARRQHPTPRPVLTCSPPCKPCRPTCVTSSLPSSHTITGNRCQFPAFACSEIASLFFMFVSSAGLPANNSFKPTALLGMNGVCVSPQRGDLIHVLGFVLATVFCRLSFLKYF